VKTEDERLLLHESSAGGDESVGVGHSNVDFKSTSQRHQRKRSHDGMTFKLFYLCHHLS